MPTNVPYADAASHSARSDVTRLLQRFGCERIGFMDDFARHEVILAFVHQGRHVQLKASAQGWAALYLREHPWSTRRRGTRQHYEHAALQQGMRAVNSILRDWVKGQVTAVECGMLSFEAVWLPYMLTETGESVIERLQQQHLLPPVAGDHPPAAR